MKNIVLIGMPGSGKTKIGKLLAEKLNMDFVDIDEYIIEQTGRDTAEHLVELGDEAFLDFEANITKMLDKQNTVIASTGSVPLREDGIGHLRKNGILVWMDIPLEIIAERVKGRADGDSRIVGAQTMTLDEIRAFRLKKYEENHDLYFTITEELHPEETLNLLMNFLKENEVY